MTDYPEIEREYTESEPVLADDVPKQESGEYCNGKSISRSRNTLDGKPVFEGYCSMVAGWGTEHVGEGRCKNHGGASPRGEDSPHFKHGLFSDFLSEEDREELEAIEEHGNLGNLQETINYEFLRLRRAVRNLEGVDEDQSFWDAYNEVIQSASNTGLGSEEIGALAELLDASYGAFNDRIESLRKLVKTYEELSEGRKVNIDGEMSHEHSGEVGVGGTLSIEWVTHSDNGEEVEDE